MVDANVVSAKLADLARRIERVRARRPAGADALAADRDAMDLVSFNLLLAVQACLDVASHVIADAGWPPATSLAGSFSSLAEHGVVSADTARAMVRAAGLRNVVAHLYAEVDPTLVYAAATHGLDDLERFSSEIATWLRRGAR